MRLLGSTCLLAIALSATAARAQQEEDRAPASALEIAYELGLSDDERRPEDQLRVDLFGRPLVIGGEAQIEGQVRDNYELGTNEGANDAQIAPEIKIEGVWLLDENLVAFADVKAFAEQDIAREGGMEKGEAGFELGEAWLLKTGLFGTPLAIQVGRQQLQDRREWWWDENLDMIRLHYFGAKVRGFVGLGRELGHYSTLGRLAPEDRDIVRIAASVRWDWTDRQELHAYFLDHRDVSGLEGVGMLVDEEDVDKVDGHLTWFGVRARGRIKAEFPGKVYYWADLAFVRGHDVELIFDETPSGSLMITGASRSRVRGWAFDIGASFELPLSFEPYLTLAYARGSGGNEIFRQTGLNGNNGKFRGNSRFRYYGEVLRPELSNLAVATIALGLPLGEHGWIETIWHDYRQVAASDRVAGSRLDIDPLGQARAIGQEFDVVASYRPPSGWDFELTGGTFRAGEAFGPTRGERAWVLRASITRNF